MATVVYPLTNKEGYVTRFQYGVVPGSHILSGTADAISNAPGKPNYLVSGNWWIASTGVDDISLIQPVSGGGFSGGSGGVFPALLGQDDFLLTFTDTGGHAHVITTASSTGIAPGHHTVTFNGTIGSFVQLLAHAGLWYPQANSGVTIA
jgi:hypothetical protein